MWAEATQAAASARTQIVATLKQAAAETGADFHYLLDTAKRESGLKPQAQSSTSSAAGLFQFVQQTWLGLVKKYGAQYGLGRYSDAIGQDADGRFQADSAADSQAILALRNDPKIAALMAGKYAQETKSTLESRLGRPVCEGELYAAHFLGAGAAGRLIALAGSDPGASAVTEFPKAACANRSVFYNADGSAKTVQQVYAWATGKAKAAPVTGSAEKATTALNLRQSFAAQDDEPAVTVRPLQSPRHMAATSGQTTHTAMALMPFSHSPLALTPGIVDVLASLRPADTDDKKDAWARAA